MNKFVRVQTKYWNGPYWLMDEGDNQFWTNIMGGKCPRHTSDKILETVEAEDWIDLDWTFTILHRPESRAGWVSPDGRFFGCDNQEHDLFAQLALKKTIGELERTGWARIYCDGFFRCARRLTAYQRNTMLLRGCDVDDSD